MNCEPEVVVIWLSMLAGLDMNTVELLSGDVLAFTATRRLRKLMVVQRRTMVIDGLSCGVKLAL